MRVAATRRLISAAGEPRRVAVFVAETTGSRQALAAEIRAYALAPLLAACLAAIVMIPLSIRLVLRPVKTLENALAARGPSDLSPIGAAVVPTEIAPLVDQLDHFIGRLRVTLERNRIFIAEAAHQLRTPLAALRGMAEVALGESDPAALRGQVDRIRRNAVGASRIVNQLLADATVANRLQIGAREPVRLDRLAAEAVNDWVGFGGEAAVRFDVSEAAEGGVVSADPAALREAIRNLIENAALHGASGAPIAVTVERPAPDRLAVAVADRGRASRRPTRNASCGASSAAPRSRKAAPASASPSSPKSPRRTAARSTSPTAKAAASSPRSACRRVMERRDDDRGSPNTGTSTGPLPWRGRVGERGESREPARAGIRRSAALCRLALLLLLPSPPMRPIS